jgi:hypothetical protein
MSSSSLYKPGFDIKISSLFPHPRTVHLDLNSDLTGTLSLKMPALAFFSVGNDSAYFLSAASP